jgi:hypothetical protein
LSLWQREEIQEVLRRERVTACVTGQDRQAGIKDMVRQKQGIRTTRASRPAPADEVEKRAIIAACESFIRDVLKLRFLPEVRPTEWNYMVDIHGAWAAGRYRFMQRCRSGMEHNRDEEFDVPFARIDRMGRDHFDIYWMRHTGKWWRLHAGVTLGEALRIIKANPVLHPV